MLKFKKLSNSIKGKGPNIVFLHGWCGEASLWQPLSKSLKSHFTCICYNLPGHGNSPELPPNTRYPDLVYWLKNDIKSLEFTPCHLVGWSLGSLIALSLATEINVISLTIIGGFARFTETDNYHSAYPMKNLEFLKKKWEKNPAQALDWFRNQLPAKEEKDIFKSQIIQEPGSRYQGSGSKYQELLNLFTWLRIPNVATGSRYLEYLAEVDLREILKNIKIPTLIIHGEDDKIVPVESGEYLAKNLPCAKMVEMPETGHIPHITRTEDVGNLIKEHCTKSSG
jgi:pimeloyl-[acyl-carrier protein] methyl ester esterase